MTVPKENEEKPKPIFIQNEHGKFENKTRESATIIDIDELKKENEVLREKLSAIQAGSKLIEEEIIKEKTYPTHQGRFNYETLGANRKTQSAIPRITTIKNRKPFANISLGQPNDYICKCDNVASVYNSSISDVLPCRYNPLCYSKFSYEDPTMLRDMSGNGQPFARNLSPTVSDYIPYKSASSSLADIHNMMNRNLMCGSAGRLPRSRPRSLDPRISFRGTKDPFSNTTSRYNKYKHRNVQPRSIKDIQRGMKISVDRSDGRVSRGTVMWVGKLPNLSEDYVGVELETACGKHDGNYNGIRYFKCEADRGLFVKFSKIIMAWKV